MARPDRKKLEHLEKDIKEEESLWKKIKKITKEDETSKEKLKQLVKKHKVKKTKTKPKLKKLADKIFGGLELPKSKK